MCATTARSEYIHIHGLPWELEQPEVIEALSPLLPAGVEISDTLLPLDKRARNTGRALLRLSSSDRDHTHLNASAIVEALHMEYVGTRWLEVRGSTEAEFAFHRRGTETTLRKASQRARQAYSRPTQADAIRLPEDARDILILCHSTPPHVSDGRFVLNNLPDGRVDVLARCATQALFVSHGVRSNTRIWFHLADARLTVACDGAIAKGLHPDERSMAAAIKRSLNEFHRLNGMYGPAAQHAPPGTPGHGMPLGWSVHGEETVEERLRALLGEEEEEGVEEDEERRRRFLVLHERGEALTVELLEQQQQQATTSGSAPRRLAGSLLVLGDHQGFTVEEEEIMEALGGVKASVSPLPLLASQCIVLLHNVLDAAAVMSSEAREIK